VLVGLVAIGLIVVAILFFTGDSGGGGSEQPQTTVPQINVGGGNQPSSPGRQPSSFTFRPSR
jgi:hypothetical protein